MNIGGPAAYGVLSSSKVRGRFRQLGATVQCTEFYILFLEREQVGILETIRDSSRIAFGLPNSLSRPRLDGADLTDFR